MFVTSDPLVEVDYGTGTAVYTYDANGNRTSVVSGGVTTNYILDEADQLQELRDGSNVLLGRVGKRILDPTETVEPPDGAVCNPVRTGIACAVRGPRPHQRPFANRP